MLEVKLRVHDNRLSIKVLFLQYHRTFSQNTFLPTIFGPVYYRYVHVSFSVHTPEAYVASSSFFLFVKLVTTRASPLGIPRDIYRGRTQFRVKSQLLRCCGPLWSCRCTGVAVELDFLRVILEESGGCCWWSLRRWRCLCDALGSDVQYCGTTALE